eukprot:6097135-Heterocapsa_arctica.AAC.1
MVRAQSSSGRTSASGRSPPTEPANTEHLGAHPWDVLALWTPNSLSPTEEFTPGRLPSPPSALSSQPRSSGDSRTPSRPKLANPSGLQHVSKAGAPYRGTSPGRLPC